MQVVRRVTPRAAVTLPNPPYELVGMQNVLCVWEAMQMTIFRHADALSGMLKIHFLFVGRTGKQGPQQGICSFCACTLLDCCVWPHCKRLDEILAC